MQDLKDNPLFVAIRELGPIGHRNLALYALSYAVVPRPDVAEEIIRIIKGGHYDGPMTGNFEEGDQRNVVAVLDMLDLNHKWVDLGEYLEAWTNFILAVGTYDSDEAAHMVKTAVEGSPDLEHALWDRIRLEAAVA